MSNEFNIKLSWNAKDNGIDRYENTKENLMTYIRTEFVIQDKIIETLIAAQPFIHTFPLFIEQLKENKHAVYNNGECSKFKWLAWIKDDKVRLLHQSCKEIAVTEFDVLVDKDWFLHLSYNIIRQFKEYMDADIKQYEMWVTQLK